MKLRALPMPIPIVWAVDAYERLGWERRVRAQPVDGGLVGDGWIGSEGLPSTAISWVAAAKMRDPKTAVKNLTSTVSCITSFSFLALPCIYF